MKGAAPPGTSSEHEAARWVRGMFGRVASRYDLLNHLLSFNMDRYWRRRTVRRSREFLARPGARVLDICCGTGDLTLTLAARANGRTVLGSDFCHPMLLEAHRKVRERCALFEADALKLPVVDGSLDLITVAFGLRNFANYQEGLREMCRVLKPGGAVAILEFSKPPNRAFAALYDFYSLRILPAIGGLVSGSRAAYQYLPESVRKFPGAEELADRMREAGFAKVSYERMTGGIVALHLGVRGE
ncbi:MAG: bifunctional demethylmenaquinone methyltransferase/2-methoxy-6-polyprenyl-1,4-benzoquinol methylase UbiE [Acidobacteriales bacterium]|nr:bifunctional demethylmenaquinone methyltransferase/2-methoxy-6-polyprenyl-1,4-benzoquinol methylase UbiE [Terriglobales bacterium]